MDALWDDYYALLGVDPKADAATVRRAWRRLAVRWHPDRAGPGATALFQDLLAAYTVLSDPAARAAYDRRRGIARESRPAPGVMLQRLSGPLNALIACGVARWAEGGVVELRVNVGEAESGGMATISMRVPVRCNDCGGEGGCARCGGTGAVEELFAAWLAVPPGVSDGDVLTPTVMLPGMIGSVGFRVRIAPP